MLLTLLITWISPHFVINAQLETPFEYIILHLMIRFPPSTITVRTPSMTSVLFGQFSIVRSPPESERIVSLPLVLRARSSSSDFTDLFPRVLDRTDTVLLLVVVVVLVVEELVLVVLERVVLFLRPERKPSSRVRDSNTESGLTTRFVVVVALPTSALDTRTGIARSIGRSFCVNVGLAIVSRIRALPLAHWNASLRLVVVLMSLFPSKRLTILMPGASTDS